MDPDPAEVADLGKRLESNSFLTLWELNIPFEKSAQCGEKARGWNGKGRSSPTF